MARESRVTLRRTAVEVKNTRQFIKILRTLLGALAILLVVVYIVTILYHNYGAFTVSVQKFDSIDYSVVLSDDPDFLNPTPRLNCNASKEVTNIAGSSIPADVNNRYGEHNGENYVAYTFACKNNGKKACDYFYEVYITNITKQLDKAVRVMLFVNDDKEVFARTASDGSGAEPGTKEFQTGNTIVKKQITNFKPGEVTKFTVVIWIEGNDPDCVDDKLGGEFKIDMSITVANAEKNSSDKKSSEKAA